MTKFNFKEMLTNFVFLAVVYLLLFFSIKDEGIFSYKAAIYVNVLIYILFSVSLNVTVGLMGQLNLGHAGFIAVGAYSSAVVTRALSQTSIPAQIQFILAIIIAGIFSGICGFLISAMTLRLKGDYLAIITLAFGEIIRYIVQNIEFLGGAAGFKQIPIYTNFTNTFIIVTISIIIIILLMTSKYGRAVLSIRENEIAAENIGININKVKLYGFFVSAFFAGIGGALFAHNLGLISPDKFTFTFSIEVLVMVVFGGIGSITGAIVSSGFITIINELLRQASEYRALIYAIILILIMIFRPIGLLGTKEIKISDVIKKIKGKIRNEITRNKKYGD